MAPTMELAVFTTSYSTQPQLIDSITSIESISDSIFNIEIEEPQQQNGGLKFTTRYDLGMRINNIAIPIVPQF